MVWHVTALILALAQSKPADKATSEPASQPERGAANPSRVVWVATLRAAQAQALEQRRPILARAGATWCVWCRKLDGQIEQASVQAELARWTLVYVDVDKSAEDARTLGIGPIPALRILTATGRIVASQDGYLTGPEFIAWLKKNYDSAAASSDPLLQSTDKPDAAGVEKLVRALEQRDAVLREAAIRRLAPYPDIAAAAVVKAIAVGPLAVRLSALELLREWDAPVEAIDPWQPATITEQRIKALHEWAAAPHATDAAPGSLTVDQLASARDEIERMLAATSDVQAVAIRERLTRLGKALSPDVYERLNHVTEDRDRERLTALRYRLVACDALALNWPGGLERLSATRAQTRHQAATELAKRATPQDAPLLLELFSDPDGLVREISLRALHAVGENASDALIKLLADPEPNVRAAVLKQLAEKPSAKLVKPISTYVAKEGDPDLVVHAVRVLKAIQGKAALKALEPLLSHQSWRVRAESAEAIGDALKRSYELQADDKADLYATLIKLLNDADGFVVGRAVVALHDTDLIAAVEPLEKAAESHPELAADVIAILSGKAMATKSADFLRKSCRHQNDAVRAAAIMGLCTAGLGSIDAEIRAGLDDGSKRVRMAAAGGLLKTMEARRPKEEGGEDADDDSDGGLISSIFSSRSTRKKSPSTQSQPAEENDWLAKFRRGSGRPGWMASTKPLLEKMLQANDAEERIAAAVPLCGLGEDDKAIPVMLAAVRKDSGMVGQVAKALPMLPQRAIDVIGSDANLAAEAAAALAWLPWDKREAFFNELMGLRPASHVQGTLIRELSRIPDLRAAQLLWDLAGSDQVSEELLQGIHYGLHQLYLGGQYYSSPESPGPTQKRLIKDAKKMIKQGGDVRQLVALTLLAGVSIEDADKAATPIFEDASRSEAIRKDALQIMLLCRKRGDAQKAAVAAIGSPVWEFKKLGLRYLARGGQSLWQIRDSIYVTTNNPDNYRSDFNASERGKLPKVPPGLTADLLRPMLKDRDPEIAACAAYYAALLQDPSGLGLLLKYWREHARDDEAVTTMVYTAIAAIGDDSNTPVLDEIYHHFTAGDYRISQFYWTIRGMNGPQILKLRKQIRAEVGMDRLR